MLSPPQRVPFVRSLKVLVRPTHSHSAGTHNRSLCRTQEPVQTVDVYSPHLPGHTVLSRIVLIEFNYMFIDRADPRLSRHGGRLGADEVRHQE